MLRIPRYLLSFTCAALLFSCAAFAATDTREQWEIRADAARLLKAKDYAGLEAEAARLRAEPFKVTDTFPALHYFYKGLSIPRGTSDKAWPKRLAALEAWVAAVPDSVAARIVLADSWTSYAWQARGSGWASTVTEEGWRLMKERLAEAEKVLQQVPHEKVNDPVYYDRWITVALGQGWKPAKTRRYFDYGVAINPRYHPLYCNYIYWLAPRWYGEEGDWQVVAAEVAATFPEKEGDWLYLQLVGSRIPDFKESDIIKTGGLVMDRVNRGITAAVTDPASVPDDWTRNVVCALAAFKGDKAAAKQLFLEIEGETHSDLFHGHGNFMRLQAESGAGAEIAAAEALERAGDLKAAEAAYAGFVSRREANGWLRHYYLRQGMEPEFRSVATWARRYLDLDPATVNLNDASYLCRMDLMLQRWDRARTSAERFDKGRSWNVLGKITLFLLAARDNDKTEAERLRESLLATKSDRTAFQLVQGVVRGEKSWEAAWAYLKQEDDAYAPQSVLAIAAWYAANGQKAEARKVLETFVANPSFDSGMNELARSLLYGSLAPLLAEPKA